MNFKEFLEADWLKEEANRVPLDIKKLMLDKGYTKLGNGVDQTAFLEPKTGKVLKIFGAPIKNKGFSKSHEMFQRWEEYCTTHKSNKFLPKFDAWSKFEFKDKEYLQIRMERLLPLPLYTSMFLHELALICRRNNVKEVLMYFAGKTGPIGALSGKEVAEFNRMLLLLGKNKMLQLMQTIQDLYNLSKKYGYVYDLHGRNFMHRNDGTPIIVDPWVI